MNENNLLSLTGGVLFHDFVEFVQLVLQYIPILHPCPCFEQFAGMKIDFDYIRFFLCRSLSGRRGCSPVDQLLGLHGLFDGFRIEDLFHNRTIVLHYGIDQSFVFEEIIFSEAMQFDEFDRIESQFH